MSTKDLSYLLDGESSQGTGRIKALLLRHKTTAAATNAAWLRQPLRPATAAAAIEK